MQQIKQNMVFLQHSIHYRIRSSGTWHHVVW